jgi:hypothetical protein
MRTTLLAALVGALVASTTAHAELVSADFKGGVFNPTVGHTKLCLDSGGPPNNQVNGTVIFDNNPALVPPTGVFNLLFDAMPGSDFQITLGSLPIHFGLDDLSTGGVEAIQFRNRVFNGFVYQSDFTNASVSYRLDMSGGTWNIVRLPDNVQ